MQSGTGRYPDKLGVVVVGQTPPPYGGQAVMIERLVQGCYDRIVVHHVRMAFSRGMDEIGNLGLRKVLHLVGLIARIVYARVRFRAPILYYPPAGPNLVPVSRDVVLLLLTRWMFRAIVFHFHAAGLSELHDRLPAPFRWLYDRAYGRPDVAIALSELNPPDGPRLGARRSVVVPYGIEDRAAPLLSQVERKRRPASIVYLGVLRESKGIFVLLEAFAEVCRQFQGADLLAIGQFESAAFRDRVADRVATLGIASRVRFPGVLTGSDKDEALLSGGVFCFPTYFDAESFGVVVLEAMEFALPVVATRWRGVPSVVEDGVTGVLVPPRDPAALAEGVRQLLADPGRAREMGRRGRERFLSHHTLARYRQAVEEAICSAVGDDGN